MESSLDPCVTAEGVSRLCRMHQNSSIHLWCILSTFATVLQLVSFHPRGEHRARKFPRGA